MVYSPFDFPLGEVGFGAIKEELGSASRSFTGHSAETTGANL